MAACRKMSCRSAAACPRPPCAEGAHIIQQFAEGVDTPDGTTVFFNEYGMHRPMQFTPRAARAGPIEVQH